MFDKLVSKLKFSVIFLAIVFVTNSQAQTPVCNLQINTFELETDGKFQGKSIGDITAFLNDRSSKKEFKPSFLMSDISFINLVSGEYAVELKKDGYQRRLKKINLDCGIAELGTVSKAIFFQKGNSKEITGFNPTIFSIAESKTEGLQSEKLSNNSTVNGKAIKFVTPVYPAAAKSLSVVGEVRVKVLIDEDGDVESAEAQSGHPLLRAAAEKAAKKSSFSPTILDKQPVKIAGIIVYNFVL